MVVAPEGKPLSRMAFKQGRLLKDLYQSGLGNFKEIDPRKIDSTLDMFVQDMEVKGVNTAAADMLT